MTRAVDAWNRFWFTPAPATTLAVVRLGVGALTLLTGVVLWPDIGVFFDPTRLGTSGATLLDATLVIAAVGLMLGFRTRLAALAVVACLMLLAHYNRAIFNAGDTLLRHLALIVALAPAGAGLSLDERRRSGNWSACPVQPIWPLRLIQLQVAVMYAAAFLYKLGGVTWRNGTAVSYPLRIEGMTRFAILATLAGSPRGAMLLTWGTLAIKAAIPLLVWNRRTRWWVLVLGLGLHLAIDVTLRTGLFSWVIFVAYLAFVPPETMSHVLERLGITGVAPKPAVMVSRRWLPWSIPRLLGRG